MTGDCFVFEFLRSSVHVAWKHWMRSQSKTSVFNSTGVLWAGPIFTNAACVGGYTELTIFSSDEDDSDDEDDDWDDDEDEDWSD